MFAESLEIVRDVIGETPGAFGFVIKFPIKKDSGRVFGLKLGKEALEKLYERGNGVLFGSFGYIGELVIDTGSLAVTQLDWTEGASSWGGVGRGGCLENRRGCLRRGRGWGGAGTIVCRWCT